ncbi:MAG: hypothetical protein J0G98_01415 [Terrimonas ferruginea]|jgi:hypothetical protein|uniref:hypothetical protein n=1 Tax=Terrimonas ferruginea TaxID=249 RepID=UPI000A96CCC6|nr:hypothetical protein [Terrimonas ferruginea]MBN8781694.1 hypothetical protein [Terrimonas ferruginea]
MSGLKLLNNAFRDATNICLHHDTYRTDQSGRLIYFHLRPTCDTSSVTTHLFLDNTPLQDGLSGDVEKYPLGSNLLLQGRTLTICTIVTSITPFTAQYSFAVRLEGGLHPHMFRMEKRMVLREDPFLHKMTIRFLR